MIIGIALIVVSFGLFYFGNRAMEKADNNIKDMNSIIESSDSKKDGLETYLNIKKESFYYDKSKLYLTPHYIINFSGKFSIIKYSDILWVYPYVHRTNGIKDTQSIIVKDKFGKNYVVANLSIITKAKKEEFNEIMNTIISKNDKMLVGYNSDNAKKYKDIIKLNKEM